MVYRLGLWRNVDSLGGVGFSLGGDAIYSYSMVQPISCTHGPHHHQKSRSFFKLPVGRTLRYPQHKIPYFTEPPTTPSAAPGGTTSPTMSIDIRSPIARDFVLYEIPYRITCVRRAIFFQVQCMPQAALRTASHLP